MARQHGSIGSKVTCGARKKDGNPCKAPAGRGTDHLGGGTCSRHGGCTPNGEAAGARAIGQQLALQRFGGLAQIVSPEEALLGELYRAQAMVLYLEDKIAHWQVGDVPAPVEQWKWLTRDEQEALLAEGDTSLIRLGGNQAIQVTKLQETGLPPLGVTLPGASGGLTVHPSEYQAVLNWYQNERKALASVANQCIKAKIEERKTQIMASLASAAISMARSMAVAMGVQPTDARYHGMVMTAIAAAREQVAA